METISYKLEHFEGPLDLLLHLIEKNKINIYDIPIVEITAQYLDYVRHMEREDLNIVSEFLVMAATLLDIKARMLLPKEVDEEGEEIDLRAELVMRLLEYKKYKLMADELADREDGAGVVETRTGKLAGSEKRESKEPEGQMELAFPPTEDEKEQEAVIEAVLFTMGRSVELRQLAAAIGQPEEVARKAVERLTKRYRSARSGMEITQLEDSYQMCTKAAYYENLIRVASAPRKQVLTEVVLETLSIIAYKQPVTKMEIEKIRGVKSDHAVNRLVEYNLVYEVGRLDAPGRPALFATTEEFLRRFGVGSVQDLPDLGPEQEAEIKAEVEEELQLKLEELPAEAAEETAGEDGEPEA